MKKYLGLVSIVILILTFIVLQSLMGKKIGHLWVWIMLIGYFGAALASWFGDSGFWRKASAVILIALPVGFLVLTGLFIFALQGEGF